MTEKPAGVSGLLARGGLLAWAGVIVVWSLLPRPPGADIVAAAKAGPLVAHGVVYSILFLLAAWNALPLGPVRGPLLAALASAAFGFGLECVQPLTGRAFEWADVAANAVGAAFWLPEAIMVATGRHRA